MGRKVINLLTTHWGFIVSSLVVFALMFLRFQKGEIQQDNYIGYALSLPSKLVGIKDIDTRLFPGLPVVIFLGKSFLGSATVVGYLAVFSAFFATYAILFQLTKSKYAFLPLVFPPAMLNQATLIASEYPAIFLILWGLYLTKIERYKLAFLILGLSVWFRPVGLFTFLGILIYFLWQKKFSEIKNAWWTFFIPIGTFGIFNVYFFGLADIFHSQKIYLRDTTFGLSQLFWDVPRAFAWGQYRILISGLFYLLLFLSAVIFSVLTLRHERDRFFQSAFFAVSAMSIFIFTSGFIPFLEHLGRYLVPLVPIFWLLVYKKLGRPYWVYLLILVSIFTVLV